LPSLSIGCFAKPRRLQTCRGRINAARDAHTGVERQRRHGAVGGAFPLGQWHLQLLAQKIDLGCRCLIEGGVAGFQRHIRQTGGFGCVKFQKRDSGDDFTRTAA
jgi:hypothetical protein